MKRYIIMCLATILSMPTVQAGIFDLLFGPPTNTIPQKELTCYNNTDKSMYTTFVYVAANRKYQFPGLTYNYKFPGSASSIDESPTYNERSTYNTIHERFKEHQKTKYIGPYSKVQLASGHTSLTENEEEYIIFAYYIHDKNDNAYVGTTSLLSDNRDRIRQMWISKDKTGNIESILDTDKVLTLGKGSANILFYRDYIKNEDGPQPDRERQFSSDVIHKKVRNSTE